MDNINELMTAWKEMDSKVTSLVEENKRLADEIKKNKLQSSQEKLMRKYRTFIILEAACIPIFILIVGFNPLIVEKYRWATLIYWIVFFLLELGIDSWLLYRLNNIDIYKDSIVEISRTARSNWKIHKIAMLAGIPLAIGAVVLICLAMGGQQEMLYGVVAGAAIGLAIGLNEFFKFMRNYRIMTREE